MYNIDLYKIGLADGRSSAKKVAMSMQPAINYNIYLKKKQYSKNNPHDLYSKGFIYGYEEEIGCYE